MLDGGTGPDLEFDFDNGTAAKSTFGASDTYGGYGLGSDKESMNAGGDSGAPMFMNNTIVGIIHSVSRVTVGTPQSLFGSIGYLTPITPILSGLVVPYVN